MKKKLILLLALMLVATTSLTSCFGLIIGLIFTHVDEDGSLMIGGFDTGLNESDVQNWLGMTEKMLVFSLLEDGTYSVGIGTATDYDSIEIPETHEDKPVTCIKSFRHGDFSGIVIPTSITRIDEGAFSDAAGLTDVYYEGTEEQWARIAIGENNEYLHSATIHFNYSA